MFRWHVFAALSVALLVAACGAAAKPAAQSAPATADRRAPVVQPGQVTAEITSSELVLGTNRFVVGLLDSSQKPIADATAHFTFYDLTGAQPVEKSEADAVFEAPAREAGLAETIEVTLPDGSKRVQTNAPSDVGVYDAMASFDIAGNWGLQVQGRLKDGTPYTTRAGFTVLKTGQTPAVGAHAPASHNLTVKDVTDLRQIDSSVYPNPDMHTESIAAGLAAGHPLLILFATPGYCTSRFCGPELELARKLEPQYQGRVDFIHVEIYKDPSTRTPVQAVTDYHLPSEPWFFLVDAHGIIRAKFEGPTGMQELQDALNLIAAPPSPEPASGS